MSNDPGPNDPLHFHAKGRNDGLSDKPVGLKEFMDKDLYGDPSIATFTSGREAVEALPSSLRVGPFDFSLQKWTAQQSAAQHCFGQFAPCEMRISIQLDMPSSHKAADTFLHELGHAIFWAYCIQDEDKEERTVAILAKAQLQVFRDNPSILPWLQRCC